jgi:hypothetical protein
VVEAAIETSVYVDIFSGGALGDPAQGEISVLLARPHPIIGAAMS